MAMIPNYGKGVSNWDPSGAPDHDATEKLMSPHAVEKPDNVTSNNKMEQYEGGSAKGKFGTLGKRGIGNF